MFYVFWPQTKMEQIQKKSEMPGYMKRKLASINSKCAELNPHQHGDGERAKFHTQCVHQLRACVAKSNNFDNCINNKSDQYSTNEEYE